MTDYAMLLFALTWGIIITQMTIEMAKGIKERVEEL